MKSTAKIMAVALALSTPLAFSQALLAASDTASKSADPPQSMGMAMMPMQQQMQRMQEQMAKLHDAANPKERRELMREHAKSMQGMMKMMHGMMAGQGMMEGQRGGMGMMMFWGLIILAIVALVRNLSGTSSESSRETNKVPLDILKERYARGEIEKPDYEEKRRELQS